MSKTKKITKILLVGIAFVLLTGCNDNKVLKDGDNKLVTFSDESLNITTNDLYEKLKEKYGISFLIDIMDTKILDKEYPDSDIIKDYVKVQVDALRNYYKTESEFLEYIASYGYENVEQLEEYFNLNYKRNLAVEDYLKEKITDDEIKKYYENQISGDIELKHILVEVNVNNSMTEDEKRTAKEEGLNKANEVITKLNDGSSFDDLVKEYSNDDATKNNGGSMGFVNPINLDDVTRQEANKLEVGKYSSQPVETEYGYEIFLKVSSKDKPSLESIKTYIIEKLSDEKMADDSNLQYKGIENIRNKYGFEIQDEDLKVYYENTMHNLYNQKD